MVRCFIYQHGHCFPLKLTLVYAMSESYPWDIRYFYYYYYLFAISLHFIYSKEKYSIWSRCIGLQRQTMPTGSHRTIDLLYQFTCHVFLRWNIICIQMSPRINSRQKQNFEPCCLFSCTETPFFTIAYLHMQDSKWMEKFSSKFLQKKGIGMETSRQKVSNVCMLNACNAKSHFSTNVIFPKVYSSSERQTETTDENVCKNPIFDCKLDSAFGYLNTK